MSEAIVVPTTPVLVTSRCALFRGEAANVADLLPPDSVDAWVTDPPAGIGFMGRGWDADKGGRDAWVAWLAGIARGVYRVLKPGAHGLVWALPRTSHWTATALEDAGFEIRDVHMHIFGTGFPKSLSIGKEIDRVLGLKRPVLGEGAASCEYIRRGEECPGHGDAGKSQSGATRHAPATAPASPEAARWEGWGTALKPAAEHWILVRKPLVGTVARNVLEHGTGALNIDACRIGTEDTRKLASPTALGVMNDDGWHAQPVVAGSAQGRWPAHLSLDEEAATMLDEQSGVLKSPGTYTRTADVHAPIVEFNAKRAGSVQFGHGDSGGASRFFYVAKPSRYERDRGCDHLPARSGGEATDREDGSDGLKNPRAGAGRGGGARNHHPTVKSIALMRWLVRLITPPGGLVLDPFCGSGSTGVAALAEGAAFVGVERDIDDATGEPLGYIEVARARLEHALNNPTEGDR